ncbi:MAG: circularly permuted type 2 ATP-grasp protein [Thermoleophilaceae bacterium]|nr:circularly permuted type 2 ATP-grasp protein [Thermoleophilaceae bacterium]
MATTAGPAAPVPPGPYTLDPTIWDEAYTREGVPRPHYADLIEQLGTANLGETGRAIAADLASRGVVFGSGAESEPFVVDLVPRILTAAEWSPLERGLTQRVRALNAFIEDAYGERRIVSEGVMPARVLDTAEHFDPALLGMPYVAPPANVAGLDLVRGPDGRFAVLEDNLRTPSGIAYMEAARDVLDARLPVPPPRGRESVSGAVDQLGVILRAASPSEDSSNVVLLSDGPGNSAWFEHRLLARKLGVPVVTPEDLELRGTQVLARDEDGGSTPVDVVYRRTDEDRAHDESGSPTTLAQVLLPAVMAGSLAVANAFGNGIGDDKLAHAYVEDMIGLYLGEEPVLPSVRTLDPGKPEHLEEALDRIGEMVVKPRTGHGGEGIVICAHATPGDRDAAATALRAEPDDWVAQELVMISAHPTVVDGVLAPCHVDLRPFVLSSRDDVTVVPGGLTRVALQPGALVVNSSQRGGGKDTWVLGEEP